MRGFVFNIRIEDRSKIGADTSSASAYSNIIYTNFDPVSTGGSSSVLRVYKKCSFASGDIEIRKHAIIITSATINACDVNGKAGNYSEVNDDISEI